MSEISIEEPAVTLAEIMEKLAAPFPEAAIYWKPQVSTRDKARAMAVAYADTRAYEDVLNTVCPGEWETAATFQPVNGSRLACIVHLTIAGVTRAGDGESPTDDDNAATSAFAQGFKRACSRFRLGRYLYSLPKKWVPYHKETRQITDKGKAELSRLYRDHLSAGDAVPRSSRGAEPAPPNGKDAGENGSTPKAGGDGARPADYRTESQITYVMRLFAQLGLTEAQGIGEMLKKGFDPATLTRSEASALIERLKTAVSKAREEQPVS